MLQKRGRVWYVRWSTPDGREHKRSLQTGDKRLAETRAASLLEQVNRAKWGDRRYTWEEAVTEWATQVAPHMKPQSARRYAVSLRACEDLLTGRYLDEIDRRFLARIAGRSGVTNATKRRDLTAISSVLRSAAGWGWVETNRARDYDRSLIRERRTPIVLPAESDAARLCAVLPGNLARLVRLLERTGMRLEEVAGLQWSQVDLTRRTITLRHTKNGRARVVPLTDAALGTLRGTVRRLDCPYVIWRTHRGKADRYDDACKALMDQRRKHGITWRTHDLRHLFAVRYLQDGGSIYDLSKILGHTSVKTTEIYLDYLTPEEQTQAMRLAGSR